MLFVMINMAKERNKVGIFKRKERERESSKKFFQKRKRGKYIFLHVPETGCKVSL